MILTARLRPRRDCLQRIGEVRPARSGIDARIGPERAGMCVPPGQRRLRGQNLVGRHAGEEIIAGVERADVIEAEPAVIAGAVEARSAHAGRAEFSRLVAAGSIAKAPCIVDAAVKLVLPHWAFTWCLTR